MSALHFVQSELERNWACQASPYYEVRKTNIDEMRHPYQRTGESLMLETAHRFPEFVGSVIGRHAPEEAG